MSVLLLDLGNTRLKWAWLAQVLAAQASGGVIEPAAIAHQEDDTDWSPLFREAVPERIVLASVAGPLTQALLAAIGKQWRTVELRELITPARFDLWRCSYAEPEKLGVDRFIAMLGAMVLAPAGNDCVVAVAGTALTIDVLGGNGAHLGGLILPGPQLMRTSLRRATAQLPLVQNAAQALGQSTETAIAAGTTRAGAALIQEVISQHPGASAFLSGGAAAELKSAMHRPIHWRPDLLFHGLALVCERGDQAENAMVFRNRER